MAIDPLSAGQVSEEQKLSNETDKTDLITVQPTTAYSFSSGQIERVNFLAAQWLDRLQRSTGCDLLAPIKKVVRVTGDAAPQSIRNRGNRINIDGREVQGFLVLGKICFDLQHIAHALASAEVANAHGTGEASAKAALGRPRKPGLSPSGVSA